MTAGQRIQQARKDIGLTLAELGKKIDVSDTYLSEIERDIKSPADEILRKLCKRLKLDFTDMQLASGRLPKAWADQVAEHGRQILKDLVV